MTGIDNVMNLGELLAQVARRLPDQPGFIRSEQRVSWRQLLQRVDSVAAALRARGLGKGDRLLVHARNNLQLFESAWVAFRLESECLQMAFHRPCHSFSPWLSKLPAL